jgi:hypothetical protein
MLGSFTRLDLGKIALLTGVIILGSSAVAAAAPRAVRTTKHPGTISGELSSLL